MEEVKQPLKGEATEEQIASWKKQYNSVYELIIEDAVCYLRKPTRNELSSATAKSENDPMLFNEILLNDCWLGGAEIIKTDDEYFLAAGSELSSILERKNAVLKKI